MTEPTMAAGGGNPPTEGNAGISVLWEYVEILRRRIWVILPIVLIASTIGLIKAFQTPRVFRATTRLLVEKQAPDVMKFDHESQDGGDVWDPDFYSTQTELMRSRAVMEIALKEAGIAKLFAPGAQVAAESSWGSELKRTLLATLGAEPAPPPEPWVLLRDKVHPLHIKDSHFVTIDAQDESPHAAADIANAAARAFETYHRERRIGMLGQAFALLQKERDKEESALLAAEKALQAFREHAQGVSITTTEDQPAVERLQKLNEQLTDVQLKRIELSSQISVMKEALDTDSRLDGAVGERLFSIPVIQTDLSLSETRKALADAEKELSVLAQTYGKQHPRYEAAETNVVLLRRQFKSGLREIVDSHDNRLQMLQAQEAELTKSYDEQKQTTLSLAKESFEYTRLKNEVDRHRQLFDALVARMREVDVTSNLAQTNIQVIEEASPPAQPVNQGRVRKVLAAAFFGFMLGAVLALMFESLDDSIKTPEDIKSRVHAPFLGFIPAVDEKADASQTATAAPPAAPAAWLRARTAYRASAKVVRQRLGAVFPSLAPKEDLRANRGTPAERAYRGTIVLSEPMSSIAEAYRGVRASLFYSIPAEQTKTISMTSSRPQEGKTTTSCNLALSIAQTGKRVLLIDGDLHRPSVHTVLNLQNKVGLTSVLIGERSRQAALQKLVYDGKTVEHLDVLPAGPSTPNPSELLGSTVMRDLLAEARKAYDWVIVDTPPILFVTDAGILSTLCDGVIVVVRSGNSTRSLLQRTTEQLYALKAHIVGTILNGVVASRLGRHYSSYYSYGYARYAKDYHRTYYRGEEAEADETAPATGPAAMDSPAAPALAAIPAVADEARLRDALMQLQAELRDSAVRAREQQAEFDVRTASLAAREQELTTRLEQTEAALRIAVAERDADRAALAQARAERGPVHELTVSDAEREARRREAEARAAERAALQRQLDETHLRIRDLEHRLAAEQARHADTGTLQAEVDAMRADLETERTARLRAEQRCRDLETRSDVAAPGHAVEGLQARLESARRENDALRTARAELERALQTKDEQTVQLSSQDRRRAQALELELANVKRAMAEQQTRNAQLTAEATQKEQEANRRLDELAVRLDDAHAKAKPPTPKLARRAQEAALDQVNRHLAAGSYAVALKTLTELLEQDPGLVPGWDLLLDTLLLGHDPRVLSEQLRRFTTIPGLPVHVPLVAEGHGALLQADPDRALSCYLEALRCAPENRAAQEGALRVLLARQDLEGVRGRLRDLLRHHKDSAYGHYVAARLHLADGATSRAEKALRQSIRLRQTPEALTELAGLLSEGSNQAEAEKLARAAANLYRDFAPAWETLGIVLIRLQRFAEGERALQRALTLAPDSLRALFNLGELLVRQNHTGETRKIVARLSERQDRMSPAEISRLGALRDRLGSA